MNPGWLLALACSGWLAVWLPFARHEYRARLEELKSARGRAIYGYGPMNDEERHGKALNHAYAMIALWPVKAFVWIFDWLITSPHLLGVPDSETDPWSNPEKFTVIDAKTGEIDDLQRLIDEEERRQQGISEDSIVRFMAGRQTLTETDRGNPPIGVSVPCPCGYTTECRIHCGNGHQTGVCPGRHTARLSKILANPEYDQQYGDYTITYKQPGDA